MWNFQVVWLYYTNALLGSQQKQRGIICSSAQSERNFTFTLDKTHERFYS